MRLSTSTNLISFRPDWVSYIPILESMRRLKAIGFDAVDLNISDAGKNFFRLADDDWKEWMEEVVALSEELQLPISQSHTPFYNALIPENERAKVWEPMIERAIIASGMAKVPWIVMHPGTYPDDHVDFRESKRRNYEYFMPKLELADKVGCGIAIENMADDYGSGRSAHRRPLGTYCSTHVDLCELVDSLNVPNVGICWDFGHAHLNTIDQPAALREIGKRLIALHVDDNHGMTDEHLAPYFGTIEWAPIMRALNDIGYDGDFTYEIFRFHYGLPHELQPLSLEYTYKIAEYMLSIR